ILPTYPRTIPAPTSYNFPDLSTACPACRVLQTRVLLSRTSPLCRTHSLAHDGLEPSRVRRNPVRHVSTVRSSGRGHACPIDERIFFQRIVHPIHHVSVR